MSCSPFLIFLYLTATWFLTLQVRSKFSPGLLQVLLSPTPSPPPFLLLLRTSSTRLGRRPQQRSCRTCFMHVLSFTKRGSHSSLCLTRLMSKNMTLHSNGWMTSKSSRLHLRVTRQQETLTASQLIWAVWWTAWVSFWMNSIRTWRWVTQTHFPLDFSRETSFEDCWRFECDGSRPWGIHKCSWELKSWIWEVWSTISFYTEDSPCLKFLQRLRSWAWTCTRTSRKVITGHQDWLYEKTHERPWPWSCTESRSL